jgi:hypothetical protein
MKTEHTEFRTNCCDAIYNYCPPCFGEPGRYFCTQCNTEFNPNEKHLVNIITHTKIADGIYRPANQSIKP